MLDARLRRLVDPSLDRVAAGLARSGLGANALTVGGFVLGVGAWVGLAFEAYWSALGLIAANRIVDGLDGAVARRTRTTDQGGFLDITLDFFFYAGVPFFFAVGRPSDALPAAYLVFSFVGTGASFLAYASVAAKRGQASGPKTIPYLGGLTEGTETIAVFLAICVWPEYFHWFAWVFGGLCWLTTGTRIAAGVRDFREVQS